jgi:hypothetical protein
MADNAFSLAAESQLPNIPNEPLLDADIVKSLTVSIIEQEHQIESYNPYKSILDPLSRNARPAVYEVKS